MLAEALANEEGGLPTPALVEFHRVTRRRGLDTYAIALKMLAEWQLAGLKLIPLIEEAAIAAIEANARYGKGNFEGGKLNLLDLMVYGVAKTTGRPILCTGDDFATTDIAIHPASRTKPNRAR